jgi:hypothetical protein
MQRIVSAGAVALVLAGCGARNLVLKVNVFSYLPAGSAQQSFGPLAAIPGGFATGEQPVVDDYTVNMLDGLHNAASVSSVSIHMQALVIDSTGSGEDTLRVYIGDSNTDPRTTTPVFVAPIVLQPGVTDTINVSLDGDSRLQQIFTQKQMRLTLTTSLRGPSSGAALNGRFQLSALDATVVAGFSGF